jgi:hypothetical protein
MQSPSSPHSSTEDLKKTSTRSSNVEHSIELSIEPSSHLFPSSGSDLFSSRTSSSSESSSSPEYPSDWNTLWSDFGNPKISPFPQEEAAEIHSLVYGDEELDSSPLPSESSNESEVNSSTETPVPQEETQSLVFSLSSSSESLDSYWRQPEAHPLKPVYRLLTDLSIKQLIAKQQHQPLPTQFFTDLQRAKKKVDDFAESESAERKVLQELFNGSSDSNSSSSGSTFTPLGDPVDCLSASRSLLAEIMEQMETAEPNNNQEQSESYLGQDTFKFDVVDMASSVNETSEIPTQRPSRLTRQPIRTGYRVPKETKETKTTSLPSSFFSLLLSNSKFQLPLLKSSEISFFKSFHIGDLNKDSLSGLPSTLLFHVVSFIISPSDLKLISYLRRCCKRLDRTFEGRSSGRFWRSLIPFVDPFRLIEKAYPKGWICDHNSVRSLF